MEKQRDGSYTGIAYRRIVNMNFQPFEKSKFDGMLRITNLGNYSEDDLEKYGFPILI